MSFPSENFARRSKIMLEILERTVDRPFSRVYGDTIDFPTLAQRGLYLLGRESARAVVMANKSRHA
jgi:hypothetical protein